MTTRTVMIALKADVSNLRTNFNAAAKQVSGFDRELKKLEQRQVQSVAHVTKMRSQYEAQAARDEKRSAAARSQALGEIGRASMVAGAAVAAGVGLSVRAAAQWESAWAGVNKTVDGTVEQMAALETEMRGLARTGSASHVEVAAVAEAAGQLGIARGDIVEFTRVMIDLGETTNLTADQAATSIARFTNIMGTASGDVDRIGAVLVDLGNNAATTEAEILQLGTRLAAAGKIAGLSEADVFAFASTLTSVGVEAEAGGTALSKVFISIRDAVLTGGDALDTFASVAGVTAEDFARSYGEDAAGAVSTFIAGLGRVNDAGESTTQIFADLELSDQRLMRALLSTAGAGELLTDQLRLGNEAWEANSALQVEAEKRYATSEAKMKVAKNAVNDLAIDLGSTLLPALVSVVEGVGDFASWIGDLPGPLKAAAAVIATFSAVVLGAGGIALVAVPKIVAFKVSVDALAASAPRAAAAVGVLGKVMGAAGLAAAAAAVGYALGKLAENLLQRDAPAVDVFTTSLRDFAREGRVTGEAADRLGDQFGKLGYVLDVANSNKLNIFDGNGAMQINEYRDLLKGLDDTLAGLVQGGNADEAAKTFDALARRAQESGHSVEDLTKWLPQYGDAVSAAAAETKGAEQAAYGLAGALGSAKDGLDNAYSGLGAYSEALGMSEEATKALLDQVLEWGKAFAGFVEPLNAYTGLLSEKEAAEQKTAEATATATESQEDSWEDYAKAVKVSVAEYLADLEKQVAAQQDWSTNMLLLAGRVTEGTLDELVRMGPEGAPLVAELVNASDDEMARLEVAFAARSKSATGAMAAELKLAQPVLAAIAGSIGQDAADALARELAAGTTTVAEIAEKYGVTLAGGLNPLLAALGKPRIAGQGGSLGGRTVGFADGGFEDHSAQIAPAGAWRVWAEPETGGEAYIPLAASKRQRSVGIWQETGRRLGVYADGGFHSEADVPRPFSSNPFGSPISTAADGTMGVAYAEAVEFIKQNSLAGAADLVTLGRRLQEMGFRVSGHAAFGGTPTSGHAPNSKHYRNRAIDVNYGPGGQSAGEMAAIDALMPKLAGLNLTEKIWRAPGHFDHLHLAMASGGVLNPHVRDSGGPLLPGYTFNGTGRPEMVLPMAGGGIHGGQVSATDTRSLTTAVNAVPFGDPAEIARLVASWKAYNAQLQQAARLRDLLADEANARADIKSAKTAEESARAHEALNRAMQATTDFQYAAAREAEASAVERLTDALERQVEANRKANAERREQQDNRYAVGDMGDTAYLAILDRRMADEQRYSDSWMALWRERERILNEQAQAEQDLTDKLKIEYQERVDASRKAIEDSTRAQEQAFDRLNDLLDQEADIRARMAQAEERHDRTVADVRGQMATREAEFYTASAAARGDYENQIARIDASSLEQMSRAADTLAAARKRIATEQRQALDTRRQELFSWASLTEVAGSTWANSAGELIRNARLQAEQFADWMEALASARRRGLSEQVIGALGLDKGPQSLSQLQQLNAATENEIASLNAAVVQRTAQASEQVSREQALGFADMTQALAEAQRAYLDEVTVVQAEHAAATAAALGAYTQAALTLQARYETDQANLSARLAEVQAEFVTAQTEMIAQLAAIGQDQGRSYADALAAGISSGIPGIQAAAAAAVAATKALAEANRQLAAEQAAGISAPSAPAALATSPFKRIGGAHQSGSTSGLTPQQQAVIDAGGRIMSPQQLANFSYTPARRATYDAGGWLQPGYTLAYNGTGSAERVLTASQVGSNTQSRTVNFMPNSTVVVQDQADMNLLLSRAEFVVQTGAL